MLLSNFFDLNKQFLLHFKLTYQNNIGFTNLYGLMRLYLFMFLQGLKNVQKSQDYFAVRATCLHIK